MHALIAAWRVSLRRTRADWPIVAAAWLITLLAATLLAGGAIYPAAAAQAGFRRALAEGPPAETDVDVSRYTAPDAAAEMDAFARAELEGIRAGLAGTISRDWRTGETLDLPGDTDDQAILGFVDGLADHATLVEGAWPAPGGTPALTPAGGPAEPIDVAVHDAVATDLGIRVGDVVTLVARPATDAVPVPVRIVGRFTVNLADPFVAGDEQLASGFREGGRFRTVGPFLTTEERLALPILGALDLHWRLDLDFEAIGIDQAVPLRGRIGALEARLAVGGSGFAVNTGLGTILDDVERSLLVSRTGVLLLVAQLTILAAYAIVLTASLLVDHRRVDTALLRSRGASPWQVAGLALLEGLLVAVPAVALAPWLAAGALGALNEAGPLADVGLRIAPRVGQDAYVAAAIGGLGCVALLVGPALLSARRFAAEQAGIARQETRTFGQRMGIDLALLVLTGIALWQLRLYGAPLTRTVQGRLGIDPLLVAAPAIGMVAGGVLALRLLPLLAQALERAVTRGRDLVLSLGSRQLARRPLRYTRSALLLMLAMSMGVFALSYGATWSGSQRDQAAYQAGADVRVRPSTAGGGPPAWALATAYVGLTGVEAASPVERMPGGLRFPSAASADLLALDAGAVGGVVHFRPDEATAALDELLGVLGAGRPKPELTVLPEDATVLRVSTRLDVAAVLRFVFDSAQKEVRTEPFPPGELAGVRMRVQATVRDAKGLLHEASSALVPHDVESAVLEVPLPSDVAGAAPGPSGPLELAALWLELWLPADTILTGGSVGITAVEARNEETSTPVSLDRGWRASMGVGRRTPAVLAGSQVEGTTVTMSGTGPLGSVFGYEGEASARIRFLDATIDVSDDVPVLANEAFMSALSVEPGELIYAAVEGRQQRLTVTGVVTSFPTTDPERPLVIVDEPTLGLRRLAGLGSVRAPDEWWLAVDDERSGDIAAALRGEAFASTEVVTLAERTRSLSTDPVALGIIGALTLGFIVTGLFAIVGLTVSGAVSARQRRTEFALLRALGLSGRQLFGSLWLENGSIVVVSLLAGTGLGLVIGWAVLPFITVTQRATAPIPPVLVEIPWDRILVLEVVSAAALGAAVVLIGIVLRRLRVGSVLRMGED